MFLKKIPANLNEYEWQIHMYLVDEIVYATFRSFSSLTAFLPSHVVNKVRLGLDDIMTYCAIWTVSKSMFAFNEYHLILIDENEKSPPQKNIRFVYIRIH